MSCARRQLLELQELLKAAQQETIDTRFGLATRQLSNFARLRQLRREIARLKFLLYEREINEAAEAEYAEVRG